MLSIDYYAYESGLRNINPRFKAGIAAAALIICIGADRVPVSLYLMGGAAAASVWAGGVPLGRYLKLLTVPLAFLLLGSAAIAIGISKEAAGDFSIRLPWFCLYADKSGIRQALGLILKALGAVSAMYFLALSTPAGEIIGVLRSIRVPKLVVELMNLIYRFIFVLLDTQSRMMDAASSRLGSWGFTASCRTFGSVGASLLISALLRSSRYYDALAARCYDGELLFWEEEKGASRLQIGIAAVFFAGMLLLI